MVNKNIARIIAIILSLSLAPFGVFATGNDNFVEDEIVDINATASDDSGIIDISDILEKMDAEQTTESGGDETEAPDDIFTVETFEGFYGIESVRQNMLRSTSTIEISPTDNVHVHGDSSQRKNNFSSANNMIVLNSFNSTENRMTGRFAFIKFNISQVRDTIISANLQLTRVSGNGASPFGIALVQDYDFVKSWNERDINYDNSVAEYDLQPLDLKLIALDTTPAASAPANTTTSTKTYDVSLAAQIVQQAADYDGNITLVLFHSPNAVGNYPTTGCDFATTRNGNQTYHPKLIINTSDEDNARMVIEDRVWLDLQMPSKISADILNLPDVGEKNGSVIEWMSSDEDIISLNGMVNRPAFMQGDKTVVLSASILKDLTLTLQNFRILVERMPITEQERVDADIEYIKSKLDNITLVSNVELVKDDELLALSHGSSVVYESDDEAHLPSVCIVTRPGIDENTAVVKLTATVTYGAVSKDVVLTIYIQKPQGEISEYLQEDLGNILVKANKLIKTPNHISADNLVVDPKKVFDGCNTPSGSVSGAEWGQYPESAVADFQAVIDEARVVYDTQSTDSVAMLDAAKKLIDGGIAFIKSANLSDITLIKNRQMNKVEFSSYRRDLMAYIWEAESLLTLEDHFYPASAKNELQIEIDKGKRALDYAHSEYFVRVSGLMTLYDDQHIQNAIQRFSRRRTDDGLEASRQDGLFPTITWYKKQHILADAYETVIIKPVADSYINQGSAGSTPGGDSSIIVGKTRRAGFFKFDMKNYIDAIKSAATFNVYHINSGGAEYQVYYMTDSGVKDWTESGLSYNWYIQNQTLADFESDTVHEHLVDGNQYVTSFSTSAGASSSNKRLISADILKALNSKFKESEDDGIITFIISFDPWAYGTPGTFPGAKDIASDFASKENDNGNFAPYIELKLNNVPMNQLVEKYDYVMDKAQVLMDKTKNGANVGDDVGNYPEQYVVKLQEAIDKATAELKKGDANHVGIALIGVYDAMREMSDHQVLRTDIDPNANMYFTADEKLQIVKKITAMPNLASFYSGRQAVADSRKLVDFKNRMFYLDPNMTFETLSEYAKTFTLRREGSWEFNTTSPSGAAYASLEIKLPQVDNEQDAAIFNEAQKPLSGGYATVQRTGHVWLDDVGFNDPDGKSMLGEENNLGFEYWAGSGENARPDNWDVTSSKGNPRIRREQRPNYLRSGSSSIYLENPTPEDEASLKYVQDPSVPQDDPKRYLFPVNSATTYAFNFATKQDGELVGFNEYSRKATGGTTFIVKFYDADGNQLGSTFQQYLNKVSRSNSRGEHTDALAYLVTGDKTYAEKFKLGMLTGLNDFCESLEVRQTYEKARANDARDEVQAGRYLAMTMSSYALVEDADVFSNEEFDSFVKMVQLIVDYCTHTRDQTIYPDSTTDTTGNWESDMYIGAALAAMALRKPDPDNPGKMKSVIRNSKVLIDNANWLVTRQMERDIANSGAYTESIRYLWAAYSRITTAARAFNSNLNDNWFEYTKLPLVFEFVAQVQTSPYQYLNNKITLPNYGDGIIGEGATGMVLVGQYIGDVREANPTLGAQLLETWTKAGKPIGVDNEGALISAFFIPLDLSNSDNIPLSLVSGDYYHQKSPIIMRNNHNRKNETYLCVISSTDLINHGHDDQGSFTIMSNGSYLVGDLGIENYWDTTTKNRYLSSSNHSNLTFYYASSTPVYEDGIYNKDEQMSRRIATGTNANATGVSKLRDSFFSDDVDKVKIEIDIDSRTGGGTHYRNLAYVKNGLDAVIVWDQVKNNTSNISQFNLPTIGVKTQITGNKVNTTGHYKTDLETTFLLPKDSAIVCDTMRALNIAPTVGENDASYSDIIRSIARKPGENHLVVMKAKQRGEQGLTTSEINTGNVNVIAYKIESADGYSVIIAANNSAKSQSVNLANGLINMETNKAFTGTVEGNSLVVLSTPSMPKSIPAAVEISGPGFVQKSNSTSDLKYNYQAMLIDQYDNKMTGLNNSLDLREYVKPLKLPETNRPDGVSNDVVFNSPHPMTIGLPLVTWSVEPAVSGVSIDQRGILSLSNKVSASKINIVAKSNGISQTYSVNIGEEAVTSWPERLEMVVTPIVALEPDTGCTFQNTYKIYDQFGTELTGLGGISWKLSSRSDITGISINNSGLLSISKDAANRIISSGTSVSLILEAYSQTNSKLKDVRTIVLVESKPDGISVNVPQTIQLPTTGNGSIQLSASVINQSGKELLNQGASFAWQLSADEQLPDSFGIDPNTGLLTLGSGVDNINLTITVTATLSDGSQIKEIFQVSGDTAQKTHKIDISGDSSVTAGSSEQTKSYTAKVYDQLGQQMPNKSVQWSVEDLPGNVVFNIRNATLTVPSNAGEGTLHIKARTDDGISNTFAVTVYKNSSQTVNNGNSPGSSGVSGGGGGSSVGGGASGSAVPGVISSDQPEQQTTALFTDVPKEYWGYEYIQALGSAKKLNGIGDNKFAPDNSVTRAEFVQMTVNILGISQSTDAPKFNDVNESDWFYDAVSACSEKGFVYGYDGNYNPYDNISRQDITVIINRVLDYYGIGNNAQDWQEPFSDDDQIAEYAKQAVDAVRRLGIVNGFTDGTFRPVNTATRGETAKIMYFVDKLIAGGN